MVGTDHQGIGRRNTLQAGRQVGGLAQCQLLLLAPASHVTHDDQAGMDTQARCQVDTRWRDCVGAGRSPSCSRWVLSCPRASSIPSPARTARCAIIFVGLGVPEVDEQAIAEILRNIPVKTSDHLGARGLS